MGPTDLNRQHMPQARQSTGIPMSRMQAGKPCSPSVGGDGDEQDVTDQERWPQGNPAADAASGLDRPIRIVLAKLGLDGHDRGVKVVARVLRDAGMEVTYLGLRQTTGSITAVAEQEDADAIGLSMHNAGHLTLAPSMLAALAETGLEDVPLILGGIIPAEDTAELLDAGVAAVLGPGASAVEVVEAVRAAVSASA